VLLKAPATATATATAALAPAASSPPVASGGSVSLRNECKRRVKIFPGTVNNGRYAGNGTEGWHGPNYTTSYMLSAGDQLCVVGDSAGRSSPAAGRARAASG
jgi:hypothetical protein